MSDVVHVLRHGHDVGARWRPAPWSCRGFSRMARKTSSVSLHPRGPCLPRRKFLAPPSSRRLAPARRFGPRPIGSLLEPNPRGRRGARRPRPRDAPERPGGRRAPRGGIRRPGSAAASRRTRERMPACSPAMGHRGSARTSSTIARELVPRAGVPTAPAVVRGGLETGAPPASAGRPGSPCPACRSGIRLGGVRGTSAAVAPRQRWVTASVASRTRDGRRLRERPATAPRTSPAYRSITRARGARRRVERTDSWPR